MKYAYVNLVIVLFLFISGCASTKVTSHVDPEYKLEQYDKPVIIARIAPLSDKKLLEASFVKQLKLKNISAYHGTDVFSPTRELTKEYFISALKDTDADSILIIKLKEGSSVSLMQYDIKLLGNKLHTVWIGNAETKLQQDGITEDSTDEVIFESVAEQVVNQLLKDGVIK